MHARWLRAAAREVERTVALQGDEDLWVDPEDVWATVEGRAALAAVAEAMGGLRPEDREVIEAAANEAARGTTKRERDRFAVRLHRARARLAARLRGWPAVLPLRWRPDGSAVPTTAQFAALTAAAGVLGASVTVGLLTTGSHSNASGDPVVAVATVRPVVVPGVVGAVGQPILIEDAPAPAGAAVPTPAPRRPRESPVVPREQVTVESPSGALARAATTETPDKAPLLCLTNFPVTGTRCVPHPLR